MLPEMLAVCALIFFFFFDPNLSDGRYVFHEEGRLLYPAQVILQGGVPYKDFVCISSPLQAYTLALFSKIFGLTVQTSRMFYMYGQMLSFLFFYLVIRELIERVSFRFLAFLLFILNCGVLSLVGYVWGGIRLGLALMFVLFVIRFIKTRKWFWNYLAGVSTGVTLLFSQEIGIFQMLTAALFLILLISLKPLRKEFPLGPAALSFAAGMATWLAPWMIYFQSMGVLQDYLYFEFFYVPLIYTRKSGHIPISTGGMARNIFWIINFGLCAAFLSYNLKVVVTKFRDLSKKLIEVYLSNILFAAMGLLLVLGTLRSTSGPQFNYFGYPVLILVLFRSLDLYYSRSSFHRNGGESDKWRVIFRYSWWIPLYLMIFVVLHALTWPPQSKNKVITMLERSKDTGNRYVEVDIERFPRALLPPGQAAMFAKVIPFVKANTEPDEKIFAYPFCPIFYFLSERPSVTRFHDPVYSRADAGLMQEIIDDLDREAPKLIIQDDKFAIMEGPYPLRERLPWIYDYVESHYRVVADFEGVKILFRMEDPL